MNLSPERISAFCRPLARQVAIEAVAETGSTNADLLRALDTLAAPALLVARTQTAGRGRAGRSWLSEPDQSLTFSLAWKFDQPLHALAGLPLATGVALVAALAELGVAAALKWPNDVLHDGRKLAGILIESATAQGGSWAVIGIGINLAPSDALVARIGCPVAAAPQLAELDRNLLMATLLNGLVDALTQFERDGLAAFTQRWNALHAYAQRHVVILDQGRVLHEGVAVGIDATGRLLLDTAAGRVAVMAGDVSLRPVEE